MRTDFETADLPHEQAARAQRQAAKDSAKGDRNLSRKKVPGSTHRFFNLLTYKLHSLGDYFWAILMYGSTDNYSHLKQGTIRHLSEVFDGFHDK